MRGPLANSLSAVVLALVLAAGATASRPLSLGQDKDVAFQAAYDALAGGKTADYLELRAGLAAAGVGEARRIFLDLWAVPVEVTGDAERLNRIEAWLLDYHEPSSWRARLAIEGADTARILRRWSKSKELLGQAEADLGVPADSPEAHWVETRAWLHDVSGVLAREMGLFDVAASELESQAAWVKESANGMLSINLLLNQVTLAMNRHRAGELRSILGGVSDDLRNELLPAEQLQLDLLSGLCFMEEARRKGGSYLEAERVLRGVAEHKEASAYQSGKARLHLAHIHLLKGDGGAASVELLAYEQASTKGGQPGTPHLELSVHYAGLIGWLALDHSKTAGQHGAATDAAAVVDGALGRVLDSWEKAPLSQTGIGYRSYYESKLVIDAALRFGMASPQAREGPLGGGGFAVELLMELQAHGTLARTMGLGVPTVEQVGEALLAEGHGLLLIQPGYERSWVFAWDSAGIVVSEVAGEHALEARIEGLQASVLDCVRGGSDSSPDLRAAETRVREALFTPAIMERLGAWSSVAIVGADSLSWLPFELLHGPSGERLGLTHALSYLPSIPLGLHLARESEGPPLEGPPRFLLAAATETDPEQNARWSVGSLAPFEGEILSLAGPYGRAGQAVAGPGANPAALRAALGSVGFAQVVAHGIYGAERTRPAGLLLAPSGSSSGELWTDDLEGWAWPDLVLLSSCGVHRGPMRRGDDGRSLLMGSILGGGARAVMLPYVDLDVAPHLEFTQDLHSALLHGGVAPGEALRQARLASPDRLERYLVHLVGVAQDPIVRAPLPKALGWPWGPTLAAVGALMLAFLIRFKRRER